MPTLRQRGVTWFEDRLKTAAGRTVTYHRGVDSVSITAVGSAMTHTIPNEDGIGTQHHSYDWTIAADDLVLDGETVTPRPGDQISETIGSQTVWWEVLDLADSRPCVEWLDSIGDLLTVHSKEVYGCQS